MDEAWKLHLLSAAIYLFSLAFALRLRRKTLGSLGPYRLGYRYMLDALLQGLLPWLLLCAPLFAAASVGAGDQGTVRDLQILGWERLTLGAQLCVLPCAVAVNVVTAWLTGTYGIDARQLNSLQAEIRADSRKVVAVTAIVTALCYLVLQRAGLLLASASHGALLTWIVLLGVLGLLVVLVLPGVMASGAVTSAQYRHLR